MKKMTKGAIVTGLGVALLLGGGGTLAVWNDTAVSQAGTIAAGDLALKAKDGVWTDAADQTINIATYKVVPGDKLTYTQKVTPTLDGDKLNAKLTVTGDAAILAHNSQEITVSKPTLKNVNGTVQPDTVLTKADNGKEVTASTTFTFSKDATANKKSTWDFSSIGYLMEQQAPTAP